MNFGSNSKDSADVLREVCQLSRKKGLIAPQVEKEEKSSSATYTDHMVIVTRDRKHELMGGATEGRPRGGGGGGSR